MATAGESSPVNKGVKTAQKSFATGGGNHARFMLGFEDVQGGTAEGVRPAGGRDLLAMLSVRRWLGETHQPKKPRRHRRFACHRTFRVAKTRQTVAGNHGVANCSSMATEQPFRVGGKIGNGRKIQHLRG